MRRALGLSVIASFLAAGCASGGGQDSGSIPVAKSSQAPGPAGQPRVTRGRRPQYSFVLPHGWTVRKPAFAPGGFAPVASKAAAYSKGSWGELALASYPVQGATLDVCPNEGPVIPASEPHGAVLWLFNYGRSKTTSYTWPNAPKHFRLARTGVEHECTGRGYLLTFWKDGWKIQAQIGFRGRRMTPKIRSQTEQILDSLRVRPAGGEAARRYHDPKNGVSASIPPGWSVDHQQLTQLADPHQVFAASSFHLRQEKPDRNCTPRTAIKEMHDGAFVFVIEREGTRKSREANRWYRPRSGRFRLGASKYEGRECFGESYQWIFRDRGRYFYAFVYLNPRRTPHSTRRAAITLLTSLRFKPAASNG
jgi:hypothetical protein